MIKARRMLYPLISEKCLTESLPGKEKSYKQEKGLVKQLKHHHHHHHHRLQTHTHTHTLTLYRQGLENARRRLILPHRQNVEVLEEGTAAELHTRPPFFIGKVAVKGVKARPFKVGPVEELQHTDVLPKVDAVLARPLAEALHVAGRLLRGHAALHAQRRGEDLK